MAWRRRARAEHPDSRPGDAAAARFRVLASPGGRSSAYALAIMMTPASACVPDGAGLRTPAASPSKGRPGSNQRRLV
jgi:hypothetical protein